MPGRSKRGKSSATVVSGLVYQAVSTFASEPQWSPPVNVYQRQGRLEVCVELAGLTREQVEVKVEPGRLTIRGTRPTPDAPDHEPGPMRILAMEIDHGRFARSIPIPNAVRLEAVTSIYREGLLWIVLPMADAAGPESDEDATP